MTFRLPLLVCLAYALTGCVTFQPVPGAPASIVRGLPRENSIVVTTRRGGRVRLANSRVVGDSLVGVRTVASGDRVAIALQDIQSVGVAETDVASTVVLIGMLVSGLALALALLASSAWTE